MNPARRSGIQELLRERGLRCTTQRFAVLDLLVNQPVHPTAEEMFRVINRSDPRTSRATIYNTLRALMKAGLVREVAQEGRSSRFGAHVGSHHHFLCDRCGNVEDMEWYNVPRPASGSLGKRILREYELIFRGLCTKCAPRRASR